MGAGLAAKLDGLAERLRSLDPLVVAFSGGADSAFLVAAAAGSLGGSQVLAVTSASAALPAGELDAAVAFCRGLGVPHRRIDTEELSRPGYVGNGPDRCYHCKAELLDRLTALAEREGYRAVATGTNADDVAAPHRPGLRAAAERSVVAPLADAGLTKADVRASSLAWHLPTWDKPQAACLASRIAYGVAVDQQRLERVDRAEQAVRRELQAAGLPVVNLRVRDTGGDARVEVDRSLVDAVTGTPSVLAAVKACGFDNAVIDPRGFRSGSLNEELLPGERLHGAGARGSWDLPIVP